MPGIWKRNKKEYPSLSEDVKCTVAVVGGGITGVLLAHLLSERGIDTALFEENRIASGKTERSTAKVTLAHRLIYSELAGKKSPAASRKYAAANLAGMEMLGAILPKKYERDMYLYSLYGERRIYREYMRMKENGIECHLLHENETPLPFETKGGICIPGQYAIDPVELTLEICSRGKFRIYEKSPAENIRRSGFFCLGHRVSADFVAVCTNYPVHVPASMAPIKLSRKTSVVTVFVSEKGFPMPDIMAFGTDGGYGYRYAGDKLVVSGETGRSVPPNAEERIAASVRRFAPDAELVESWINNDTYTHDGVPYVGKLRSGIYTACGYSAWGMSGSATAAVILVNNICGKSLWYEDIFAPGRNFLSGCGEEFSEHLSAAAHGIARSFIAPAEKSLSDVGEGEGAVVINRGRRVGAYRDNMGEVHLVSLKCPHLGCSLEWDPVECTWDCPCHGSRFSYNGKCLSNPADRGISIE